MPRSPLSKSIRASAAASVVACTSGLVNQSAEAATTPVWIDLPSAEGVYAPERSPFDPLTLVDVDSDGLNDFSFLYYSIFQIGTRGVDYLGNPKNPVADILYSSLTYFLDGAYASVSPALFSHRDEVYTASLAYTALPDTVETIVASLEMDGLSGSRNVLGGTLRGGDGNMYAVYFDLEVMTDDVLANNSLTVYDAGYTLILEQPLLLLGDANNDGAVDAFDITAVEQNFGNTGTSDGTLLGDANDDGKVDAFDITSVEQNFGNTLPTSASTVAVPEPSSLAVLGMAGLLAARRRM